MSIYSPLFHVKMTDIINILLNTRFYSAISASHGHRYTIIFVESLHCARSVIINAKYSHSQRLVVVYIPQINKTRFCSKMTSLHTTPVLQDYLKTLQPGVFGACDVAHISYFLLKNSFKTHTGGHEFVKTILYCINLLGREQY